tara:strand:- start:1532 stop:1774 length:243 start_codon:yes stop_codon:yes gene_type:complete
MKKKNNNKKNNKKNKYIVGGSAAEQPTKFGELLNNFLVSSANEVKKKGEKFKNIINTTINQTPLPPKNIKQGGKKINLKK